MIRDRFIEEIAKLFKIAREEGVITKWADGRDDAEEILSLKLDDRYSLEIVDEGAELPEQSYASWAHIGAHSSQGYKDAQQDMLRVGYVKKVGKE